MFRRLRTKSRRNLEGGFVPPARQSGMGVVRPGPLGYGAVVRGLVGQSGWGTDGMGSFVSGVVCYGSRGWVGQVVISTGTVSSGWAGRVRKKVVLLVVFGLAVKTRHGDIDIGSVWRGRFAAVGTGMIRWGAIRQLWWRKERYRS